MVVVVGCVRGVGGWVGGWEGRLVGWGRARVSAFRPSVEDKEVVREESIGRDTGGDQTSHPDSVNMRCGTAVGRCRAASVMSSV